MSDDDAYLSNLSSDIIINILSRLPVQKIVTCKSVCKSWLQLLETREFAKSHLSKSPSGLLVYQCIGPSKSFKIFEFLDNLNLEPHELHYNLITKFEQSWFINPPYHSLVIVVSVNGLLCLREVNTQPNPFYICNPITRECVTLPRPSGTYQYPTVVTYGFGVSSTSGQYKVVRILHECDLEPRYAPKSFDIRVYTLGEGSWRSVELPGEESLFIYNCRSNAVFMNGNFNWLLGDLNGSVVISCFNLATELFDNSFPAPPLPERQRLLVALLVLQDCLTICDNSLDDEIVIWVLKEKSWTKEFVISKIPDFAGESYEVFYPLKVFENGDILISWGDFELLYYSKKSKKIRNVDFPELPCRPGRVDAVCHVPSFLKLKGFEKENVRSF